MLLRKFMHHSYRYIFILFVFLLPLLRGVTIPSMFDSNAYAYLIYHFGGLYPTKSTDIMELLLKLVPNIFLLYLFSDIMREDCMINYVYVFTRMGKKQKWLFQKAFQLFVQVFVAYALLYVLSFLIAGIAGLNFGSFNFQVIIMLAVMFFLNVLVMFFLVFLQNFLSLRYGGTQAFLFVMLLYVICLAAALTFYNYSTVGNVILALLVPTNQMYIWHTDCTAVHGVESLLDNPLNGFQTINSFIVLVIYIVAEYFTARFSFLKLDLAEMIKEA